MIVEPNHKKPMEHCWGGMLSIAASLARRIFAFGFFSRLFSLEVAALQYTSKVVHKGVLGGSSRVSIFRIFLTFFLFLWSSSCDGRQIDLGQVSQSSQYDDTEETTNIDDRNDYDSRSRDGASDRTGSAGESDEDDRSTNDGLQVQAGDMTGVSGESGFEELPGEACGWIICPEGEVCCNESCGTCAAKDDSCPQQICADAPEFPESDRLELCDPQKCSYKRPEMPTIICSDGTIAGTVCLSRSDGSCEWETIDCPKEPRESCGECPDDAYCDVPNCGRNGEVGFCRDVPRFCAPEYKPVCGCDGIDYSNPCLAHLAGVDVDTAGHCEYIPKEECGGVAGVACPDGQFCEYPIGTCEVAGEMGTCRDIDIVGECAMENDPVCGCDGNTYGNRCSATSAGVSIDYFGKC